MQYRVFDRQSLQYKDGGYCASWTIDDDYIVNNNSTISLVKPTKANVGDIIALIQTSGTYHKGVITNVDNSALTISYKSDKELFNDNLLNVARGEFAADKEFQGYKFGLEQLAEIIKYYWGETSDPYKKLPIVVITAGATEMIWKWDDNAFNFVDWLVELFQDYNVVLSWDFDFDMSHELPEERNPKIVVNISAITDKGGLIKDNVAMQTITYTSEVLPEATVCIVLDGDSKEIIEFEQSKAIFYLCQRAQKDEQGRNVVEYYITQDVNDTNRMLPVKTVVTEFKTTESSTEQKTVLETAQDALIPSKYSQAVEIKINRNSKMFDFDTAVFGAEYTIIGNYQKALKDYDLANEIEIKNYSITSNYTGRKESSGNEWITLYFGLGRKNYTDLIQMRFQKEKYHKVYNV